MKHLYNHYIPLCNQNNNTQNASLKKRRTNYLKIFLLKSDNHTHYRLIYYSKNLIIRVLTANHHQFQKVGGIAKEEL